MKNSEILVKNWCSKMEPLRDNCKCYRKSDSIFWKPRKFPSKPCTQIFTFSSFSVSKFHLKMPKFHISYFLGLFSNMKRKCRSNYDSWWEPTYLKCGANDGYKSGITYIILSWMIEKVINSSWGVNFDDSIIEGCRGRWDGDGGG